ncbi:aspartic proteinase CDR1-like [Argentina anserina]|uniref:aspartic proteinase CDR1-like n=1 Tax=Argentina anserina TaxID=57926 RepID=UPI002176626E|nr:aspartic proteinase CDR1-like [Potentilla anserina]
MANLYLLHKHNCMFVVITLLLCHLVYYCVTATTYINHDNGGFNAHLIRKSSRNSPFDKHKKTKIYRRLIGSDTPGSLMRTDPNSGAHIMKFSMGSPPFDIYAMADTGSHLLWTQCQKCKACYKSNFGVFDPRRSSTYKNINCRAKDCRLVGHYKPQDYSRNFCRENDKRPCLYSFSYADGASTTGVLSKETVTLTSNTGKILTLKDIIFGCGYSNNETINTGNEMGVIGLGRGPLSFVSQIAPYVGGKRFSHCLVGEDVDDVSNIYFGKGSEVLGEGVVTTPLVDTDPEEVNYFVTVQGISIENDFVPYNSTGKFPKKGNFMVDSGTPVTRLPQEFFDRLVIQLKKMVKLQSFVKYYPTSSTSNLCFKSKTLPKLPTVAIHFEGGGKLQLAQDQLLYNDEPEVFCFGMAKHTVDGKDFSEFGIYGGDLQTNMLIGFDMDKKLVSFKPMNCASLNYH